MNAVGIDVSNGKSTVAILHPQGIVVASPYDVPHTGSDLKVLVATIKMTRGETHGLSRRRQATIMSQLPAFSMNKVYLFP